MTTTDELLERLSQTQQSFLEELLRHEVRFVVVGGFAVILYASPGYDRSLADLDVLIEASVENLGRLGATLETLGAERLSRLPSAARPEVKIVWHDVEVFTSMPGFDFAEIAAHASVILHKSKELRVMSYEGVVKAKKLAVQAPDRGDKRGVDLRDLVELSAGSRVTPTLRS